MYAQAPNAAHHRVVTVSGDQQGLTPCAHVIAQVDGAPYGVLGADSAYIAAPSGSRLRQRQSGSRALR